MKYYTYKLISSYYINIYINFIFFGNVCYFIFDKYPKTKINILNNTELSYNEEITNDLIEIITVYSSKLYDSRTIKNKIKANNTKLNSI